MRKCESLFYKINTCLQKTTTCTGSQAEQILSANIWYTYFSILDVPFAILFLCYFQKLQLLAIKKFWTNFLDCTLIFISAKGVSQIFKSYFKLEILIFFSFVVFFSRYIQLKSSFSDEKNISREIWDSLVVKLWKINVAKC